MAILFIFLLTNLLSKRRVSLSLKFKEESKSFWNFYWVNSNFTNLFDLIIIINMDKENFYNSCTSNVEIDQFTNQFFEDYNMKCLFKELD